MKIPGFSDYDISDNGEVLDLRNGKVLNRTIAHARGESYPRVSLRTGSGYRVFNVLYLLALAFVDKPEGASVARAIDGNNLNTSKDNVMWVSRSSITKDAWDAGKMKGRGKRPKCYSEDSISMVYEALQAYEGPVNMVELSHALQVPYSVIRYSIEALRDRNMVRKVHCGFEVI